MKNPLTPAGIEQATFRIVAIIAVEILKLKCPYYFA